MHETVVRNSLRPKCETVVKHSVFPKCETLAKSSLPIQKECFTLFLRLALFLARSLERNCNFSVPGTSNLKEASSEKPIFIPCLGDGKAIFDDSCTLLSSSSSPLKGQPTFRPLSLSCDQPTGSGFRVFLYHSLAAVPLLTLRCEAWRGRSLPPRKRRRLVDTPWCSRYDHHSSCTVRSPR